MPAQNQLPSGWSTLPPGWSAAAPGAAAAGSTPAGSSDAAEPGLLDQLASWGAKTFPNVASRFSAAHPATSPEEVAEEFDRPGVNIVHSALRNLTAVPAAAADWFKQGVTSPTTQRLQHLRQNAAAAAANGNQVMDPQHAPSVTPDAVEQDATDTAGGVLAGGLLGEAAGGVLRAPSALKRLVRGSVDESMAGTTLTPRQRYDSAKRMGVNLPPAQATNSPVLKPFDITNRDGFLSGGMHDKLFAKNNATLTGSTDALVNRVSPFDAQTGAQLAQEDLQAPRTDLQNRAYQIMEGYSPLGSEQGGARIQALGKNALDQAHRDTTGGYESFFKEHGHTPVANPDLVTNEAYGIQQKNDRFAQQSPSLVSKKVANVVRDATQLGSDTQRATLGRPTVGDLIRTRSGLLDLNRDPEIIKSSHAADVQRLISAHDQAIMESLPPEGQDAWRGLNAKFSSMKDTFDNPSRPFYNAVRTPNPSSLVRGIGGATPEAVSAMRSIVGGEGAGIVARGVGEDLLGRTGTGEYDLSGFGRRLENTPEDYRNELFGGSGHEALRRIAQEYQQEKPFEKAATTTDPESLFKNLSPETAGGLRNLMDYPMKPEGALGPAAPRLHAPARGALQRAVLEDLLGKTRENGYNFKTFGGKLARMNEGYRDELFGPEHDTLRDIANTANAMDTDYNRSGSGKLAQRTAEMYGLATGLPLVQYPIGKFMSSPGVSDWLMKPDAAPNPLFRPGVGAGIGGAVGLKKRSTSPFVE